MATNDTCFNYCDAPVVTTIQGRPVCQACFDHYMGIIEHVQAIEEEYIAADRAVDLRGF